MNKNMNLVLNCENLSKNFDKYNVIHNLDFQLYSGQILSILGSSGCGKTTLLRLISGLEELDRGEIFLNDVLVSKKGFNLAPHKRNIGMVFQNYSLFPHMTVFNNIAFGLKNFDKKDRENRVKEVLEITRLEKFAYRYPQELSGGQQQRVAVARTLAPRPTIMLLDEPFSNLDAFTRSAMLTDIQKIIRDSKVSTILVTHDREEAFATSDYLAIMVNGKIVQFDKPDQVVRSPNDKEVASLVLSCGFLDGEIKNGILTTILGNFSFRAIGFNNAQIDDEKVTVLIRPEDFNLTYDPNGNFKVLSIEFRGMYSMVQVQSINHGFLLKFIHNDKDQLWGIGSNVNLIKATTNPLIVYCRK